MKRIGDQSSIMQFLVWSVSLGLCISLLSLPAFAVGPTGMIVGTVVDQTGAAVPGARVSAINQGTSETRTVETDGAGNFSFPVLPVGNYTIRAEKPGFHVFEQKDIVLQVDQNVTVPVTMQLGEVTQTIEVVGSTAGVDLVDATVSHVVDQRRIVDLPLNGRDTLQLQFVMPGVSFDNNNVAHGQGQHEGVVVNGNRPGSNYYLLDGVDMTDSYLAVAPTFPAPDALQEFDIQTSDFNAQYGRNSGGIVNAATKAGTNEWHGDLFEFVRNDVLNANNFFSNKGGVPKPPYKLNQFGGSIGGPIQKNKSFIFGYFQQTYQRKNEATTIENVLTSAERPDMNPAGADFSALCAATPGQCPRDPRTGQPFPNNIIPQDRIDPASLNFIKALMPLPNSGTSYIFSAPQVGPLDDLNESQFVVRIDHTFNEHNTLFGRYFFNNDYATGLGAGDNIPGTDHLKRFRNNDPALSWTHTFSPTLLNTATVGFNRLGHFRSPVKDISWGAFGGPPTASQAQVPHDLYIISSGTVQSYGDGAFGQNRQTWQFSDALSWVRGKHSIAFGGDYRRESVNRFEDYFTDPVFTFNGQVSGNTLSDLLLGLPSAFREDTEVRSELRHSAFDLFATDTVKVKSNLTLDLGLRWEPYFPPVDNLNDQICLDPTFTKRSQLYPTAPPGLLFPGVPLNANYAGSADPGCPRELIPKRWGNLAPRVGFNWDPFKTGKTSVRAGYGIFYDQMRMIGYNRFSTSQPWDYSANIYQPGSAANNFAPSVHGTSVFTNSGTVDPYPYVEPRTPAQRAAYNPFFGGNWPTSALEDALNPNFNEGYAQEWNFTVQREIAKDYSVSVSYVGNHAVGLWISREFNWGIPLPFPNLSTCTAGNTNPNCPQNQLSSLPTRRRLSSIQCNTGVAGVTGPCYGPFELEDNAAWSTYNSLQISVNHKFKHGIEFLGSYVWGRYLDIESYGAEGGTGPRDPYNLGLSYGPSDNDVRHRFVISYIWQVPKMKRFSGASSALLNGWQVQGITTIQSGSPFTVSSGVDTALTGIGGETADLVAGQRPTLAHTSKAQEISEWFNTSAFQVAAWGTYGQSARNMLYGPGIVNFDFSLFKEFMISERWGRIQFRNEYFNLFNHANFYNPDSNLADGSAFGQIFNARDPRFIQFALKWVF
jgi:hypothetical protein